MKIQQQRTTYFGYLNVQDSESSPERCQIEPVVILFFWYVVEGVHGQHPQFPGYFPFLGDL
jgi:hypothetical protein